MKKIIKILLFLLPIFLFIGFVEYKMSKVESDYSIKAKLLEEQKKDIEVVFLGGSQTAKGVNPEKIDVTSFNLGNNMQTIFHDTSIISKKSQEMPKLKLVVFNLILPILDGDIRDTDAHELFYYYDHYYHTGYQYKRDYLDLRAYSKIFMFGYSNSIRYLLNDFTIEKNKGYIIKSNGFMEISEDRDMKGSTPNTQEVMAEYSKYLKDENREKNERYLDKAIEELKNKGIEVVFLITPTMKSYSDLMEKNYLYTLEYLKKMKENYNIQYFDYFKDSRFSEEDFLDISHLNRRGANRFSKMINEEIIENILGKEE